MTLKVCGMGDIDDDGTNTSPSHVHTLMHIHPTLLCAPSQCADHDQHIPAIRCEQEWVDPTLLRAVLNARVQPQALKNFIAKIVNKDCLLLLCEF